MSVTSCEQPWCMMGKSHPTLQDLLHALVAELRRREALQRRQHRVGAGVQQQPAALHVSTVGGSVQRRLTQVIHGIHLRGDDITLSELAAGAVRR